MLSGQLGILVFVLAWPDPAGAADAIRGVAVEGLVRNRVSHEPLVGVVVELNNGRRSVRAESNGDGRIEGRIEPGVLSGRVVEAPAGYVKPLRAFRAPVELAVDAKRVTLPTIELDHGSQVRGQVVDEHGQPVAGAWVQCLWYVHEPWLDGTISGAKLLLVRSDERGEFVFSRINSLETNPWLSYQTRFCASADGRSTAWQSLPPVAGAPLKLQLSRAAGVLLGGRVTDVAGQGVADARVEVRVRWHNVKPSLWVEAPVSFAERSELVTDGDGRFQAPRALGRDGEYSVTVRCDGYQPSQSPWIEPGEEAAAAVPDVRLRLLRTVAGRVVDHQRRPLAAAHVFQSGDGPRPTETITGDDGRFLLTGVGAAPAMVFAERDGYRFQGEWLADGGDTEIVLSRRDEPVAAIVSQAGGTLPREDELSLARQVVRPYIDRALEAGERNERHGALVTWARLDPGNALARIDDGAIADLDDAGKGGLQTWAVRALMYDDFDEAVAVAASMKNVSRRTEATVLLAVTSRLPAERKRELLEEALLQTRSDDDPNGRALWLQCLADAFLDLGDVERGRELLAKAQAEVVTLPPSAGNARRFLAEALARTDLAAALALAGDVVEEPYRDGVYGKIAYRIAGRQPAEALRVLERVNDHALRDQCAARVCYRMATTDPERAHALAWRIASPYRRALALGWTARGCAASDKVQAREWLDEAFAELAGMVAAGEGRLGGPQCAAVAAALLLPAAEAIDPQLVAEYLWRAVSYRRPHFDGDEQEILAETATLALLLAPYDRALARRLLAPIVELIERKVVRETSTCSGIVIYAAGTIDPRWAAKLVERLATDGQPYFADELPWAVFAWAMGAPPEQRLRRFVRDYFESAYYFNSVYWLPGEHDNPFQSRF